MPDPQGRHGFGPPLKASCPIDDAACSHLSPLSRPFPAWHWVTGPIGPEVPAHSSKEGYRGTLAGWELTEPEAHSAPSPALLRGPTGLFTPDLPVCPSRAKAPALTWGSSYPGFLTVSRSLPFPPRHLSPSHLYLPSPTVQCEAGPGTLWLSRLTLDPPNSPSPRGRTA